MVAEAKEAKQRRRKNIEFLCCYLFVFGAHASLSSVISVSVEKRKIVTSFPHPSFSFIPWWKLDKFSRDEWSKAIRRSNPLCTLVSNFVFVLRKGVSGERLKLSFLLWFFCRFGPPNSGNEQTFGAPDSLPNVVRDSWVPMQVLNGLRDSWFWVPVLVRGVRDTRCSQLFPQSLSFLGIVFRGYTPHSLCSSGSSCHWGGGGNCENPL